MPHTFLFGKAFCFHNSNMAAKWYRSDSWDWIEMESVNYWLQVYNAIKFLNIYYTNKSDKSKNSYRMNRFNSFINLYVPAAFTIFYLFCP